MQRKLTITVDEEVYKGLHNKIGRDRISSFLNRLVRPYVVSEEIEASFRRMASDEERESEAEDWIEGIVGDIADEKN